MAISQQDYYLKQGESVDQYNARIAALRGETPAAAGYPTQTQVDAFKINSNSLTPQPDLSTKVQVPTPTYTPPTTNEYLPKVTSPKNRAIKIDKITANTEETKPPTNEEKIFFIIF